MDAASGRSSVDDIVARLERLPTSWWQVKARIIVGVATFFDAFDALAIASILPVIVPLWKLTPPQIGLMISAGFLGQLLGALLFGWIAERYGRMTAMIWSIALFGVMSLVCALAWDYNSLLAFRTIQGIGLGGEVPVAAVFISELARAQGRGRFVLLYELVFPIGLVAASLVGLWVVPHLGWQYMFVIGALPALLTLALRRLLPESPRWLAVHGREAQAQAAMALIETETQKATGRPLPPPKPVVSTLNKPASLADLFGPLYLRRTLVVWVIWFSSYFVNYGLSIWLPTVYRTVFKLPLDVSLRYGLITQAVGLLGTLICALAIDHVGRRLWFASSFAAAAVALAALALFPAPTAEQVLACMTIAYFFISTINIGVYLYTPELYPTRVRALGVGAATAWLRFASMIGPTVVGMMLAGGLPSVFVHIRNRRGDRRRGHRPVRNRDQGPRAGGGIALTRRSRGRIRIRGDNSTLNSTLAKVTAALQRGFKIGQKLRKPSPGGKFMRILKLMFASVAAAALFGASAAQSADPVKIRLSWVAPVTNWASILLEKKDLAQHLGKSYTLEPVRFAGTPPMVTALANGELEIANLAYSTLAIAIQNAGPRRSAHHRR